MCKKTCVHSDKQLDAMAPQAGQPISGWRGGARGVKEGCSVGPGEEEAKLLCTTCGLEQPSPGAEGSCHREPSSGHASNSHTSAQGLLLHGLKLAAERQTGLFNILPQFWERVHSSGLLLPSISMLGRCRKDSEQSGLEGMRPRFGCHGTLKHRVPVADEGTS